MIEFDIKKIPFSSAGSYFVLTQAGDDLVLRDLHGGDTSEGKILAFKFDALSFSDKAIHYQFEEHQLQLSLKDESISFSIPAAHTLRIYSNALSLNIVFVLSGYDHVNKIGEAEFIFHSYTQEMKYQILIHKGRASLQNTWDKIKHSSANIEVFPESELDISISYFKSIPPKLIPKDFGAQQKKLKGNYSKWSRASFPNKKKNTLHDLATYILWSASATKEGILPSETVFASKNYMNNNWSWDHCFYTLAIASTQPERAYKQFIFFKGYLKTHMVFPDYVNDVYASFSCVKPPIHGWTYLKLMKMHDYFTKKSKLREVLDMLIAINQYWIHYRMQDGLVYYNHGNDSGWDNSTVFAKGVPVFCPDIFAHLLQNTLAIITIAKQLGNSKLEMEWKHFFETVLSGLVNYLYDGNAFNARLVNSHEVIESHSLLLLMPIIAAKFLPKHIQKGLVSKIMSDDFLTEFGLATESLKSTLYKPKGYWRGPIWAPVSLLIIDGLYESGYIRESASLRKKFLKLCEVGGLAENFNATTGEGLCDHAFLWTASVYMILYHNLFDYS